MLHHCKIDFNLLIIDLKEKNCSYNFHNLTFVNNIIKLIISIQTKTNKNPLSMSEKVFVCQCPFLVFGVYGRGDLGSSLNPFRNPKL